jgi:carbon storage regulator
MLVLSRAKNESIMIGDDVEITILKIRGNKVSLGITAPEVIPVHRREVFDAINSQSDRGYNRHSVQRERLTPSLSYRFGSSKALCVDSLCCSKK